MTKFQNENNIKTSNSSTLLGEIYFRLLKRKMFKLDDVQRISLPCRSKIMNCFKKEMEVSKIDRVS